MYSYVITTDDSSAADKKIEEIKKGLTYEFDEISFDLEEEELISLLGELNTVSLFDSPKFVLVRNPEKIAQATDSDCTELYQTMNNPDSENILVFLFIKDTSLKGDKLEKLKKYATTIDIRIKNIPLDQYALRELTNRGMKINEQALSLLISYVDSMSSLDRAIEILECYKSEDHIVKEADIEKMIAKPLDDNVYLLVDAVLSHYTKDVFQIYKDLKILNVQPSFLISLLINKFQELYNVSILVKSNASQAYISSVFNVSSGRAYYMMKGAKSQNIGKIKENLEYLNQLDADMKSGKVDPALGLEFFFLK